MDKPLINQGHSLVREACKSISNHTFRGLKVTQKKQKSQPGGVRMGVRVLSGGQTQRGRA